VVPVVLVVLVEAVLVSLLMAAQEIQVQMD
jgi:flagellar biosynthesis protein FliQ